MMSRSRLVPVEFSSVKRRDFRREHQKPAQTKDASKTSPPFEYDSQT